MNSRPTSLPRLVVVPLASLVLLTACSRESKPVQTELPSVRVTASAVSAAPVAQRVELTGTVRPVQRAVLAAKLMGSISEMPVVLGQHVGQGDLLVRLNAAEVAARVTQAQAGLDQAHRELARERALLPKGASTADLVRGLEERLAGAEGVLREAQALLAYAELRAPFTGVIARKLVTAGDLASPGMPLLELEGTGEFEVEVAIPESLAEGLASGSLVPLSSSTGVSIGDARVKEISSTADTQARSVLAKLAVPASVKVRSGQFVRVSVPGGSVRLITVPSSAVSVLGQMERVFVVENGRAVMRLVKTGGLHGRSIEISAGLSENERVITTPSATLRDGQPVEVTP